MLLALAAAGLVPAAAAAVQERAGPEAAASATPLERRAADVVRLLNAEAQPAEVFTRGFRSAIADAQIKALAASMVTQFGPALEVAQLAPREGTRASFAIRLERGMAVGQLAIAPGEAGRISELLFTEVDSLALIGDSPEAIAADLAALPGQVNAWFGPLDGGPSLIAIAPDTPLALGSTVKLYVLAALAEEVKAGRRRWSDIVALDRHSYPSGQMQDWPRGSPVTLHTLASQMIAISDNTATDQLIAVLGKERILEVMRASGHGDPAANTPLLTTRELFALKASPEPLEAWRKGDARARAKVLEGFGDTAPPLAAVNAAFARGPKALDVEWFASPVDLALLFAYMRRTGDPEAFEILAINPSATPAIKASWAYLGYKGGSEPGVLNLTWLLRDAEGRDHVLTLGWNDPDAVLDEGKLEALAHRILLLPR